MIRKILIILFFKVNPFCFSQEYSVEILGISVAEIKQMSVDEYYGWLAYFDIRNNKLKLKHK